MLTSRNEFALHSLLVLCAIPWCAPSLAAIPESERETLIALYTNTDGGHWYDNTNWCSGSCPATGTPTFNAPGTECTWRGVGCDADHAHVKNLSFGGWYLNGQLPSLVNLPSLISVYAPGNHLTGSLVAIDGLTNLQEVELDINELTGAIPDLRSLTSLVTFTVSRNHLTGSIPDLSSLSHLGIFDVDFNQLTGPIPNLQQCPSLNSFRAEGNQLTGNIPPLAGLNYLTDFFVSGNQLSGQVPELAGLPMLRYVHLGGNRLTGKVPAFDLLGSGGSSLCPNLFDLTPSDSDEAWNVATGYTPWWASPHANNLCDDLFSDGLE